jgi:hypothetical protein
MRVAAFRAVRTMIMENLKKIRAVWKRFAQRVAAVQTYILISLLYGLIIPFFSLIRLGDPLRLRTKSSASFWIERPKDEPGLEQVRQQF